MSEVLTPDICVIGGGPAGIAAAVGAAYFGAPVVLITKDKAEDERDDKTGLSLHALSAAAGLMRSLDDAKAFGVNAQWPKADFSAVSDHIEAVLGAVAGNGSPEQLGGLGIEVIAGTARFESRRVVAVGDRRIKARRFILATGSVPAVPAIPGLEQAPYFTEASMLEFRACPKHLAIIGADSTGLELAQAYRRLGAAVTVLDAAQPLLPEHDAECTAILLGKLEAEGIVIRAGVKISQVKATRGKVQLSVRGPTGEETIEASHLLLAGGRAPNVGDLNLDAAGIRLRDGKLVVNAKLKTTNRKIYAIGDVVAGRGSVHLARCHARLIIRNALFRLPSRVRKNDIPRVIHTAPALAQVGMTETEARQRRTTIRILRWSYADNDCAVAQRQTAGHIKVITSRRGRILGATIVGAKADELVTAWALAITQGLSIRAFAELAVPYPSFTEIGKQAAITFYPPGLARPWLQRIMSLVRLLG